MKNKPRLKNIRQYLRKNMPVYEKLLWQKIRNKQLGIKFRRQFSIENFIIDFYSPEFKLAIEIDGDSHFMDNNVMVKDKLRDKVLYEKYKIKVLRFTNSEIKESLEDCLYKILEETKTSA